MHRLTAHWLAIKICLSDYVLLTRAITNNLEAASAGLLSQPPAAHKHTANELHSVREKCPVTDWCFCVFGHFARTWVSSDLTAQVHHHTHVSLWDKRRACVPHGCDPGPSLSHWLCSPFSLFSSIWCCRPASITSIPKSSPSLLPSLPILSLFILLHLLHGH